MQIVDGQGGVLTHHSRASAEVVDAWCKKLRAAALDLAHKRSVVRTAEERLQKMIVEAFDAGLTAVPIHIAAGLSMGRIYQIKQQGTREWAYQVKQQGARE